MHSSPADWSEELPPHQLFNLISSGKKLRIVPTGGSGSLGVTLPIEELRKRGLNAGDAVVLLPTDDPDTFELHFPPPRVTEVYQSINFLLITNQSC